MKKQTTDPLRSIRDKLGQAAEESGLSRQEIGEKMGLGSNDARKAISRLLTTEGYDPRLSTLIKFAEAIQKPLKDLL